MGMHFDFTFIHWKSSKRQTRRQWGKKWSCSPLGSSRLRRGNPGSKRDRSKKLVEVGSSTSIQSMGACFESTRNLIVACDEGQPCISSWSSCRAPRYSSARIISSSPNGSSFRWFCEVFDSLLSFCPFQECEWGDFVCCGEKLRWLKIQSIDSIDLFAKLIAALNVKQSSKTEDSLDFFCFLAAEFQSK